MSVFNTVVEAVPETCPACRAAILRSVQFHFGDCWHFEYRIGDEIRWGGNDEGEPGLGLVVVEGYGDQCPNCGDWDGAAQHEPYEVWIRRDRIESVRPYSGRFASTHQKYVIVEEGPGGEGEDA
jgi:hypothetical protein